MPEILRLTPSQRSRCNRLIKRLCANYDDGNCLLLDDGEPCVCPQSISYSLNCKWFRTAVLPNDKELYIKLMKPKNRKKCTVCGNEYTPTGRNSKYCDKCRRKIRLRKDAERKRNKRSMSAF